MLVFPHFRSLSDTTCHKIGMLEDSKSMLLLDNCNTHSHKFEQWSGNISVLYFPPSVMRPIQPMDQEVIHHKCYYWQGCLHKLVNHEGTVKDFLCTYTIKDAVFNVACAWNSVKAKNPAPSLEAIAASYNDC